MAHSRIFQLSEEHISLEEDGISAEHFYQDVDEPCCKPIFYVADYINDNTNRDDDIRWLLGTLPEGYFTFREEHNDVTGEKEGDTITFYEGFKEAYFAKKLQKFLDLAESIKQDSSVFLDPFQTYLIRDCVESKTGFYIYLDENGYESPMDCFVRDYLKIDQKYYIGNTIDYHY